MYYAYLSGRGLIELSGDDAAGFLQGLVSNDVTRMKDGVALYAALLSPQGKFLHDFFLMPGQGTILIDCDSQAIRDLQARLAMYKLRSKVTIQVKENMGIAAVWGEACSSSDICHLTSGFPDPRLAQLGFRMIGDTEAIRARCEEQGMQAEDGAAYERLRLSLGVPDGARDMIREKSLLLEFGFEDLHGVDFNKGCYVGQEVTARSKYRGQTRRFIYRAKADGELPPCGTPVTLDGAPAGELRSSIDGMGLALLTVAAVEKAQSDNSYFQAGNKDFRAILAPWVAHPPKALTIAE